MSAPPNTRADDSTLEPSSFGPATHGAPAPHRIGWRRRALVVVALVGCVGLFGLARWLAATPELDAQWAVNAQGGLVLQGSPLPELQGLQGRALLSIVDAAGQARPVNSLLLHRSPRWQVDDPARALQVAQTELLAQRLAAGAVELVFDGGVRVTVPARPRGHAGLGLLPWPLAGVAVLLVLTAMVVVLARPDPANGLFMVISLCQAGNLLLTALQTTPGLGLPPGVAALDLDLRLALDAATAAAMVHAFALHPHRLPRSTLIATLVWPAAALAWVLVHTGLLSPAWWWAQALCVALGATALGVIGLSSRVEPNPYTAVMRRMGLVTLGALLLVTAAVAATAPWPKVAHGVAVAASVAWYLFLASLLLLTPFLARSRQVLREFAMLAGISTVATSVDLLFVAVFSLEPFTSLAAAVFLAVAIYGGARQYVLNHLLGSSMLTAERMFDLLYRAAREVQLRPRRHAQVLGQLLQDLFEPLEVVREDRLPARARVIGGGSALVVPVRGGIKDQLPDMALRLRFAQRGKRLFTPDDARLADRAVEQLRRAVAYDQAVERGRHEERQRLAQDLHDDIGARLLTLMYQAPNREMEDYIRHTLKDLKTLTRGLAASEHPLSHAAAEWKADLTQRLSAAQGQLAWACTFDRDLRLSVVQWSAMTRVLRELVSNALYHGRASRVDVVMLLQGTRLTLTVVDDGEGSDPQSWSHGLGLGGVRKRVKLLGGTVHWRENTPRGIVCDVCVEGFSGQP
jgi:signal transduction histidine kinase